MLELTFQGDPIRSTGEYFPSPYINKVTINNDTVTADIIVFINNAVSGFVFTPSGVSEADDAYSNRVLGTNIFYYILWLKDFSEEEYQSLTNGDVNPLRFYHNNSGGQKFLNVLDINQDSKKQFLDRDRNFIDAFVASNKQIITNPDYVMCFASTFDYFSNSGQLSRSDFSEFAFDLQVGELSYERVYNSDGEINSNDKLDFVDSQRVIYDRTPLQSVDKTVYKIDTIDHQYIKDNIESLLNEYDTSNNDELKKIVDSIYLTLETSYEDYDIINKLDALRVSFPNKTPSNEVGKLYKRFSRRLYNINSTVRQSQEVFKTVNYNTKIQSISFSTTSTTAQNSEDSDTQFLYTDWKATNLQISGLFSSTYNVIFGYFFLDYEKLLRKNSYASQFVDVNKLEKLGLQIPYDKFYIEKVRMFDRVEGATGGGSTVDNVMSEQEYPITKEVDIFTARGDLYSEPNSNMRFALTSTPYGAADSNDTTAGNGFCSHLINRKYTPIYDNISEIQDYRLMMFEYLEYRNFRDYTSNTYVYDAYYTTKDTTVDILINLKDALQGALDSLTEYQTYALEQCTFNSDLGAFNEFFVNGILSVYEENPQLAPWYIAPINYVIHMDLFYNLYEGDIDQIENAASAISRAIDPYTGTIEGIETLISQIEDLKSNTWDTFSLDEELQTRTYNSELNIPAAQEVE